MTFTMSEIAAIQNYTKNGQAGNSVNLMEKEAIEYAKENNCTKEEAMNVLYEQYNKATGSLFTDEVMANAKDDRGAFLDGFLEGVDIFGLFDTTSKQQALNDLADIEPSTGEKIGEFAGNVAVGAVGGAIIGAIIGGIFGGVGGALLGAKIGGGLGTAAGTAKGIFGNKEEETFTPKPETAANNDKDTTLAQEPEDTEKELEEEKEENV